MGLKEKWKENLRKIDLEEKTIITIINSNDGLLGDHCIDIIEEVLVRAKVLKDEHVEYVQLIADASSKMI